MLVDAPKAETTGFASWYANLWLEEPITLRAFTSLLGVRAVLQRRRRRHAGSDARRECQQPAGGHRPAWVSGARGPSRCSSSRSTGPIKTTTAQLLGSIPEADLYEAALTVMMRLVFLFSAEERGLLLLNDELYAQQLRRLHPREQLRKTADDHGEEILERRHDAWCRLLSTFRAVYGGVQARPDRRSRPTAGTCSTPTASPSSKAARPGTTWKTCEADPLPVNNRTVLHLLEALQLLEVRDAGRREGCPASVVPCAGHRADRPRLRGPARPHRQAGDRADARPDRHAETDEPEVASRRSSKNSRPRARTS